MKIKLFILGLVFACIGLSSFTSATNYACYDDFTISENSYFIIDTIYGSNNDTFSVVKSDQSEKYCYSINDGFTVNNSCSSISSFPLVLSPGRYSIFCNGNSDGVFSVVPVSSVSDCPTCPTTPSLSCSNTGSISEILDDLILYSGSVNLNSSSYTNIFNYGNNGAGTYCVKLTSSSPQTLTFGFANGGTTTPTNLYQLYNDQYNNYVCLYGNKAYFNAKLNSSSNTVSYEVYRLTDLYSHDICVEDSQECPSCQDCSLLSGDLATCQGSLGACIEDNTSLENMNSSLQDQLSQCLASGGSSCDPEVDEDCYTGAYQLFHVFRQNQGSDFSLPISNNIFLPSGLRAYTDSGVVALAPLTPNDYSLDRESGEILNDLVIKIFYYLAVLLSVMALAYYIKKFLSFTLFPKKD